MSDSNWHLVQSNGEVQRRRVAFDIKSQDLCQAGDGRSYVSMGLLQIAAEAITIREGTFWASKASLRSLDSSKTNRYISDPLCCLEDIDFVPVARSTILYWWQSEMDH